LAITLGFMFAAIAGWNPAYAIKMGISALRVVFFWCRRKACPRTPFKF
jgi:hypothetical protein